MQEDFDPADNGLVPCHLRVSEGMIFVHLTQALEPPDFDEQVGNDIHPVLSYYGSAELKVAVREQYPIHGNWKLALENFLECYHCGPSHRSLVTTHNWDQEMPRRQRAPSVTRSRVGHAGGQARHLQRWRHGRRGVRIEHGRQPEPRLHDRLTGRQAGGAAAAEYQGVDVRHARYRHTVVAVFRAGLRRPSGHRSLHAARH